MKHTPVFFEQTIEALQVVPGKKYIDATAGEGGHLKKIAELGGTVLAMDYDEQQIARLKERITDTNITLVCANFRQIRLVAHTYKFSPVAGILFDLGLSMGQLANAGKGLSYKTLDDPLDMQISGGTITAEQIVNTYHGDELKELFVRYAEELHADKIASSIVGHRKKKRMHTVGDLVNAIQQALLNTRVQPNQLESTYARIFQALRMEVNEEIDNVKEALEGAVSLLEEGGRLVVITFHSLEDRLVKQFAKTNKHLKEVKVKIGKFERKRFERSAQLRIYYKTLEKKQS